MNPTAQEINTFVAQPINNLIVFLAIAVVVALIIALVLVGRYGPKLYNLFQQQADTNKLNADTTAKLTAIAAQNAEQAKLTLTSTDKLNTEMVKQTAAINTSTAAIDNQTQVIQVQNLNHNAYQTLVSDGMSAVQAQVAENTAGIADMKIELKESIAALTEQINALVAKLDDKAACADAEERMRAFRDEIKALLTQQQAKKTSDLPAVNLIPDTDANGAASVPTAA